MKKVVRYLIVNNPKIFPLLVFSSGIFTFLLFPLIINSNISKNFLSSASNNLFLGLTSLVVLILLISWNKMSDVWRRYKITHSLENPPFIYLDGIFIFLFLSLLLVWGFQGNIIPKISDKFIMFIFINIFLTVVWLLSSYFLRNKSEKVISIGGKDKIGLSDEPIYNKSQDLLHRDEFIENLYKEIISLPFTYSFVFGLYGKWGEGKTSVINLLINEFHKRKNVDEDKYIIVDFKPGYFKDEKTISSSLYKQIMEAINRKFIFPDFEKTLRKYYELFSFTIPQTGIKLRLPHIEKSIEEIKYKIGTYLSHIDRKLLIFIDDIDRLQTSEIMLIFKLIKINLGLKNSIFILAFEPAIIKQKLENSEFLDKIVQKATYLPKIEQSDIDNFLKQNLFKLFEKLNPPQEWVDSYQSFQVLYNEYISRLFTTLRHVKRYLNSVYSTLPPIKSEVNLKDFLILEVIKMLYPEVYDDIRLNYWYYIPFWGGDPDKSRFFRFMGMDTIKDKEVKEHIDSVTAVKDRELLLEMLKEIFFVKVKNAMSEIQTSHDRVKNAYRQEKRLTHPGCFDKYFMYRIYSEDIPDSLIEEKINSWDSKKINDNVKDMEKTFSLLQKNGMLNKFLERLNVFIDKVKPDTAKNIIKAIYMYANKFNKESEDDFGFGGSEFTMAWVLTLILILEKFEDKSTIREIIEEVISQTSDFCFAVIIIYELVRDPREYSKIINAVDMEKLKVKLSSRLEKYFLEERKDILEEIHKDYIYFVIKQWSTNWEAFDKEKNKEKISNYILNLVKKDRKKFIDFLRRIKTRTGPESSRFEFDELEKIYNIEEFYKIGKKFKDKNSLSGLSENERGFIEEFLNAFEQYNKESKERK